MSTSGGRPPSEYRHNSVAGLGLAIAGLAGAGMIAWFTITESIHPHPAYWRGWTYIVLAIGVMGAAAATLIAADRFPGLNSRLRPAPSPRSPAAQPWISRAVRLPLVFIGWPSASATVASAAAATAPNPPPPETTRSAGKPARPTTSAAPGTEAERLFEVERASLGEVLRKELNNGLAIESRIPMSDPRGTARARAVATKSRVPPDRAEARVWEKGIESYLSVPAYEAPLSKFKKARPVPTYSAEAAAKVGGSGPVDEAAELRAEMKAKLDALAEIVEALTPAKPIPPSSPQPKGQSAPKPSPIPAASRPKNNPDPLVDVLQALYEEAVGLQRTAPPRTLIVLAQATTEDHVLAWEGKVEHALRAKPKLRARFSTAYRPSLGHSSSLFVWTPWVERLMAETRALESIIQELAQ